MNKTTDVGVINYALYEGANEFVGITQVDLPSLEFMTQTISGAGIAGEIETILVGQMNAMSMTLTHTVLTKKGIQLSSPKVHDWELREVQQYVGDGSAMKITGVKHVIKAIPKSMGGGSLKPHSTSDPNTVADVIYWAEYRDGEKVLELDPLNGICYIDGVDYLADVRTALGK